MARRRKASADPQIAHVHDEILEHAAEIANRLVIDYEMGGKLPRILWGEPKPFRPVPTQTATPGFSLMYDLGYSLDELEEADRALIQSVFSEIATRAVRDALSLNADKLAGLIVGEARQGRNYFDHFS